MTVSLSLSNAGTDINSSEPDSGLTTQQNALIAGVGFPEQIELNASVTFVRRNITITQTSRVLLDDAITLKIHDNKSDISVFNYTIPSEFNSFVENVKFYSQFETDQDIQSSENLREYSVLVGAQATVYSFSIEENGTVANSSLSGIHIHAKLEAIGAVSHSAYNDDQLGRFITPVRPVFPNLPLEDSVIGLKLESGSDGYLDENITKIDYGGNQYPISKEGGKILEWSNMTGSAFDPLVGLQEHFDYTEIVFASSTVTEAENPSVVVPFIYSEAKRDVRIDPWGMIYVKETVTILHTGAPQSTTAENSRRNHAIGGVNVLVYGGALVTDIYDELGSMNSGFRYKDTLYPKTQLASNAYKQGFTAEFRNPIYGGESYTFSYDYRINATELILVDGSKYTMNTTLFSDYNTTVTKLDVVFELPAGAYLNNQNFRSHSPKSTVFIETNVDRKTLSFFRHVELHYTLLNASFTDNRLFQIEYTYKGLGPIGLGHMQYIFTYIICMIGILSLFLAMREFRFTSVTPVEIAREQVPIDKIETFFNLFRERSGASKRIADLRNKRKRGKISKKDYDGQIKAIQRRIREINPQLDEAARELTKVGAKYEAMVSNVMLSSQRQKDIRSNTLSARKAYNKGETPKDIYQKLMREYSKDLEKQETIINKTLSEMHELIQQYS
ncbi:MAG: hypothetical protein ACXAD7_12105 [Candidatus Kariarchaeaceae archaeon]|jgi:hypothetical protein